MSDVRSGLTDRHVVLQPSSGAPAEHFQDGHSERIPKIRAPSTQGAEGDSIALGEGPQQPFLTA